MSKYSQEPTKSLKNSQKPSQNITLQVIKHLKLWNLMRIIMRKMWKIKPKLWKIDSIKQQKTLIFQYIIKIFVCSKQKQAELMHQEEPKLKQSK